MNSPLAQHNRHIGRIGSVLRHPALVGRVWKLLGAGLMVSSIFVFYWLIRPLGLLFGNALTIVTLVDVTVSVGVFLSGRWLFRRGKKVLALLAADRARDDPRPPVLYLRSFQDDTRAAVAPEASGLQMMFGSATEEEQLASALSEIGPFIGIGRPGETLPELGAARFYVAHDEWQERVRTLIATASLVVLRVGKTPGFFWEVQHAAGAIAPEKLVFLLPYDPGEYENFRWKSQESFPVPLPLFRGGPSLGGSFLGGVLYFDRDWTPHVLHLKVPFVFTTLGKILNPMGLLMQGFRLGRPFTPVFKRTLRPVLKNNGLRWRWPPRHPLLYVETWLLIGTWTLALRAWLGGG